MLANTRSPNKELNMHVKFSKIQTNYWKNGENWCTLIKSRNLSIGVTRCIFGLVLTIRRSRPPTASAELRALVATDYEIRNSTIEGSHVGDSFNREGRYCSGPETYRLSSWAMGERLLEGGHGDSGQTGRWSHIPARKLVRAIPLRGPNQRLHDPQCPRK